jgi:integrase
MARVKLTKRSVEATTPSDRDIVLRDTELKGFLCKVTPSGRRIYFCYYRSAHGQERRPKIGEHGELTVQQAREIASDILSSVRKGSDPSMDRQKRRIAPNVEALGQRYIAEYAELRHKPSYLHQQKRMLKSTIVPHLGHCKVAEVTYDDIATLHNRLKDTPFEANRVLSLLRGMFKHAILWGLRQERANPCQYISKFHERKRDRLLTDDEVRHLHLALDEAELIGSEHPHHILAIRLLFATACRIGEIIALDREFIRWTVDEIHWPDSKTGSLVKPLTQEVRNILTAALENSNSRWVVSSVSDPEMPLSYNTVQKAFKRLLDRAHVPHATLHSIRHRCATEIANTPSIPIKVGMQLTGHRTVATFMGYVHTEKDPVRAAAEHLAEQRRKLTTTPSSDDPPGAARPDPATKQSELLMRMDGPITFLKPDESGPNQVCLPQIRFVRSEDAAHRSRER